MEQAGVAGLGAGQGGAEHTGRDGQGRVGLALRVARVGLVEPLSGEVGELLLEAGGGALPVEVGALPEGEEVEAAEVGERHVEVAGGEQRGLLARPVPQAEGGGVRPQAALEGPLGEPVEGVADVLERPAVEELVVGRDLGAGAGPLVAGVLLPLVPAALVYGVTAAALLAAALALRVSPQPPAVPR